MNEPLRSGKAMRVIFFYPGEEGTYVDNAQVVIYASGLVNIKTEQEESTTHISNCEILWFFEANPDNGDNVRKLKVVTEPEKKRSPVVS
jgi:hypothetical protein